MHIYPLTCIKNTYKIKMKYKSIYTSLDIHNTLFILIVKVREEGIEMGLKDYMFLYVLYH